MRKADHWDFDTFAFTRVTGGKCRIDDALGEISIRLSHNMLVLAIHNMAVSPDLRRFNVDVNLMSSGFPRQPRLRDLICNLHPINLI